MPIDVVWTDETCTTLCITFEGVWTLDELAPTMDKAIAMTESQTHTVHRLLDMREANLLPRHILTFIRHQDARTPDNIGLLIIIGGNQLARALATIAKQFRVKAVQQAYFVQTPDEALKLVAHLTETNGV